ncbi:hypothetical protein TWF718_002778 [Orbilia javanica]|uniref:Uncharacterized protein n=1 Tax=Orbilia javanica TaxID=47235 RepID=A0AAN8MM67_9PEZI
MTGSLKNKFLVPRSQTAKQEASLGSKWLVGAGFLALTDRGSLIWINELPRFSNQTLLLLTHYEPWVPAPLPLGSEEGYDKVRGRLSLSRRAIATASSILASVGDFRKASISRKRSLRSMGRFSDGVDPTIHRHLQTWAVRNMEIMASVRSILAIKAPGLPALSTILSTILTSIFSSS